MGRTKVIRKEKKFRRIDGKRKGRKDERNEGMMKRIGRNEGTKERKEGRKDVWKGRKEGFMNRRGRTKVRRKV